MRFLVEAAGEGAVVRGTSANIYLIDVFLCCTILSNTMHRTTVVNGIPSLVFLLQGDNYGLSLGSVDFVLVVALSAWKGGNLAEQGSPWRNTQIKVNPIR